MYWYIYIDFLTNWDALPSSNSGHQDNDDFFVGDPFNINPKFLGIERSSQK